MLTDIRAFHKGVGFPSSNRELAVRKRNRRDPNGFYAELCLPTWATEKEIKSRCRALLKTFHPDGKWANREIFERIEMIYRVLGNPAEKAVYDHTPEGMSYLDQHMIEELKRRISDPERLREAIHGTKDTWSYLHVGDELDHEFVDQWYRLLCKAASDLGYRCSIRVDFSGDPLKWGGWVAISPDEEPSEPLARERIIASNLS